MAFTNKTGRTETSLSEINVTPFVDVVLVLLIIFMLTAPVLQSGIEVSVPKTKTVKAISEERMVITITKGQEVYLGNDHVKLDELGDMLHKKIRDPQGQAVYVRADQDVAFGAFATVMSTVKQAGISNVSIVTEPIPVAKK
jgi:biopolymer transport protein ExbD/biopolymer transport protein TolR